MRATALLVGILSLAMMSLAGAQTIYKWVDAEGVTNYGSQPPLGVNAERTATRLHGANRQTLQTRINNSAEQYTADTARRQENNAQVAKNKVRAKEEQALRSENCEKAKTRKVKYNISRRLYRELENGERDYLTDDELDQERANAQKLVNEWCD